MKEELRDELLALEALQQTAPINVVEEHGPVFIYQAGGCWYDPDGKRWTQEELLAEAEKSYYEAIFLIPDNGR